MGHTWFRFYRALAQCYLELGATFVTVGNDIGLLANGASRLVSEHSRRKLWRLAVTTGRDWPSISKSALNAVTVALSKELVGPGIKVNAADPGYTATDFNGHPGYRTVEQAASGILLLLTNRVQRAASISKRCRALVDIEEAFQHHSRNREAPFSIVEGVLQIRWIPTLNCC